MPTIHVPFEVAEDRGVTIPLEIPEQVKLVEYCRPEPEPLADVTAALLEAVENPIGGPKFSELIAGGKKVIFLIENQFRQARADLLLPTLVEKVKEAGGTARIICGSGKVGALNDDEVRVKIGAELFDTGIEVTSNDPFNHDAYTFVGVTKYGIPLWVHNWVMEADVKITIGSTQATLWGYGGSGMIMPGTSSDASIELNHIFTLSPESKPGNNDCLVQLDKYEALRMAGIDMGINVITDNLFRTSHINAGDPIESHLASIAVYDETYRFEFKEQADIVICGSTAPTNHLFFHTSWAVVNCDPVTRDTGTIIFASPCPGYFAWEGFALMDVLKPFMPPSAKTNEAALRAFYERDNPLWAGCIWYKVYEVMTRKRVEYITLDDNLPAAHESGLTAYGPGEFQAAFDALLAEYGPDATVAFVPYGRYTILTPEA
ncbi:MAG: lactate racemase domain-containing protein [Bacillota bacterium]|nr:lactate racemase domain-containing protein [Bacillota bacterium]